jgi:tripartite-type tricarboxylate transporter receptor subunit TctC
MPDDIVQKLASALRAWVESSAGQEKLAQLNIVANSGSADDLKRAIDAEISSLRPIVESGALAIK